MKTRPLPASLTNAPRPYTNRTTGLAVTAFCVLIGIAATGCHSRKETAAEVPPPRTNGDLLVFPTNSPQLSSLTVESVGQSERAVIPLAGRLIWDEEATVRVFTPFAGIVRKIIPAINQRVQKGAPLAEIQSSDFAQAQADERKAESDFRRADRNLARLRDLFDHGAAPRKDVESAEADFASAEAEKSRAHARLAIYGADGVTSGHDFLLPSPLDGMVVEKNVTPGQEVRPDQMLANLPQLSAPLFVISDPSRLWLQIEASEADLSFLKPGQEFTFTSRAFPDQTFTGRVDTVSEFIDPTTRTIRVRGTVDNTRRLLKAEMFVSVNVPGKKPSQASVPAQAVFLKGDKHYVFVERQRGEFLRKEVQLGPEQDQHVMILSGLEPGQQVVTQGCLLLQSTLK